MTIFLRFTALSAALIGLRFSVPMALSAAVLIGWVSLLPREDEKRSAHPAIFAGMVILTIAESAMNRSAAGIIFAALALLAWRLQLEAEEEIEGEARRISAPVAGRIAAMAATLEEKERLLARTEEAFQRMTRRFEIVRSLGASLWFEGVWGEIETAAGKLLAAKPVLWLPPLPGDLPEGFHPAVVVAVEDEGAWRRARNGERVEMKIGGRAGVAYWFPLPLGNETMAVLHLRIDEATADAEALEIFVLQVGLVLEKMRLYHEVELQSRTDLLTGLPHHANFRSTLEAETARSGRAGRPLSLLMIDVDFFKAVNDTHGHLVGDQVLVGISRMIRTTTRITDFTARYGGEEFAVILPETALPGATEIAERIRQAVAAAPIQARTPAGETRLEKTISIGVAEYQPGLEEASALIKRADAALYRAKEGGRNRVEVAAPIA
jgi:diguanylate cyclase (GGDEF)-like protein